MQKKGREIRFQASAPGSFFQFTQDWEIFDVFHFPRNPKTTLASERNLVFSPLARRSLYCKNTIYLVHYIAKTLYIQFTILQKHYIQFTELQKHCSLYCSEDFPCKHRENNPGIFGPSMFLRHFCREFVGETMLESLFLTNPYIVIKSKVFHVSSVQVYPWSFKYYTNPIMKNLTKQTFYQIQI